MSRYKAYGEYKDSGVEWIGEIPSDWDMWKITHACPYVASGTTPKSDGDAYYGGETLWVTTGELREGFIFDTQKKVTDKALIDMSTLRLHPVGSVAIAMYGATIGRLGIFGKAATTNQACCVMPPSKILQNKYIFYWLFATRQEIINLSSGGGQPNVNQEKIASLKVSAPAYDLQEKIANFLDHETAKIDTLIAKQQELIKLLKEKRQAVISHAVTKGLNPKAPMRDSGVEWLGEVPAHWVIAKLSFRFEVLLGKMLDEKKITGNFLGPYLRNTDVQWDRINTEELPQMDFRPDEMNRYSVKKGDLIVCEGGEIGRCAIWEKDEPCFYQKALHRLRPLNSLTDSVRFMFYLLFNAVHQERFISGAGKSTIAHLPAETFRQFKFGFPPKQEQVEIAIFLEKQKIQYDLLEARASLQIGLLQERRTALISAAVTGKIDVRDWRVPVSAAIAA